MAPNIVEKSTNCLNMAAIGTQQQNKPTIELNEEDSKLRKELEDFTFQVHRLVHQLPKVSRTWTLFVEDMEETTQRRQERIDRKSENILEFMKRFPVDNKDNVKLEEYRNGRNALKLKQAASKTPDTSTESMKQNKTQVTVQNT